MSKPIALIPPEGDKDVGKRVFEVLSAILADKENLGLPKLWSRHYKLRRNKHWKEEIASVPLISANLIFTHVQRSVNTLTDNNPIFNVANMYAGDDEKEKSIATDLQRAAEDWWLDNEQQDKLESSVINGEMYGICIEKSAYNPDLDNGLGDVETRIVDPFHFGWYPVKMADLSDLQGREAVVEFYVKSCRELANKYPKLADKIKPETTIMQELNDERLEINSDAKSSSGNNLLLVIQNIVRAVGGLFKSTGLSDIDGDETVVCEMWVRDKTRIEDGEPTTDEETGEVVQSTKPKYTGEIRYILACSGGQVVLEDKDNPNVNPSLPEEQARQTYLYSRFPYNAANSIKDTSNAWGICYDDKTEILTKTRGFVKFSDLNISDDVATRNNRGEFEWQKPTHYIDRPYSGDMFRFNSRSMDISVTPDHKMLVSFNSVVAGKRNERFVYAKDLINGLNSGRKIPVTSKWESSLPEIKRMVFPKSAAKPSKDIIMSGDDYCALLGAYLAEGNLHSQSGIEVAQMKSSKGYSAYKDLFDRLGVTHDGKRWRLYGKTIKEHFAQFGHSHEKFIPVEIRNLPKRQLEIVWNYFVLGDGNFKKRKNKSGRGKRLTHTTHITTTSRMLSDNLVEIGQKLGFSVSVREAPECLKMFKGKTKISNCRKAYNLCCRYSDCMGVQGEVKYYEGHTYCVTVPNGVVYVRRNGKPTWCGNCDIEDVDKLNIELNKALSQFVLEKDQQARRKIINPKDSGVKNDELMSYPGILNPSSAATGEGIRYLEMPPSNGDVEKAIELFKGLFMLIAGTFDLDQAQTKSNVIAYKAIAALLERAATMMRGKIRSYSRLIRERGRMYISHVQNFYTEDRWITYQEPDGQTSAKQIRGSEMARPVNLTVVTGSTLPISRVQQREEALSLFQSQAIDQQELLEKLDWGNRNDVIKRMQAGPLGAVLEKLTTVGFPDEILQYIQGIAESDPKKLQQGLESGEFPPFPKLMEMMINENLPAEMQQEQQPNPEVMELQAKVNKLEAEAALIAAKVQTEAVNQQVALAGVQFDDESMKINRAQAVHDMERDIKNNEREDAKVQNEAVSNLNNRPGYNERGMKSNNKQK